MLALTLRSLSAAIGLALGAAGAAHAATIVNVELVCPIDGEKFEASLARSGTVMGYALDLKPHGAIVAPWPLAKCPTSGFVIYQRDYSAEELARLRAYVGSDEYRSLKDAHTNYYLSARLRAHLGESPAELAYILLQATWEAGSRLQYEKYAAEALEAFRLVLAKPQLDPREWVNGQLVAGELERRLGQFERARARFASLAGREEFRTGTFRDIVALQLRLIEAQDREARLVTGERVEGY